MKPPSTAPKQTGAERVRESEERLRRVIEATGAGTWDLDLVANLVTADSSLRALHGFPPEGPFSLEAAVASVEPADRPQIRAAIEAALDPKGSRRYFVEYRVANPSGQPRWIEARGRAYFDADGKPSEILGTAVDVTARKEAELAREGLLAALEAQPFLQVAILEGPTHVVKRVNAEYRANVAGGRDIVGKPVLEAFPDLAGQGFDTLMKRVLETGEPFVGHEVPTRIDRGTGILEERFFNFVVQPVRGPHGVVDTLLNISHDVTHFVQGRRELEGIAAQEKERADFERQLIGIVSHDLRNPLSTIRMGVALLLRQESLEPAALKTVARIQTTLEQMVRLVNDLLDFTQARLGSGLPIVRAPMNLHGVIRQVAEEVQMTFPEREIQIEAQGDGEGRWDRRAPRPGGDQPDHQRAQVQPARRRDPRRHPRRGRPGRAADLQPRRAHRRRRPPPHLRADAARQLPGGPERPQRGARALHREAHRRCPGRHRRLHLRRRRRHDLHGLAAARPRGDRRDLIARHASDEAVFSVLHRLDDPGVEGGAIGMLHEELLGADPSGREGRPGSAPPGVD